MKLRYCTKDKVYRVFEEVNSGTFPLLRSKVVTRVAGYSHNASALFKLFPIDDVLMTTHQEETDCPVHSRL